MTDIVRWADEQAIATMNELDSLKQMREEIEEREAKEWERFHAILDGLAEGKRERAVALIIHNGGQNMKAGRSITVRGAGVDPTELALKLKSLVSQETYGKLVMESQQTIYHVNESAVSAAATENALVARAIKEVERPGMPVVNRIFPRKATADDIAEANRQAAELVSSRKPRQMRA